MSDVGFVVDVVDGCGDLVGGGAVVVGCGGEGVVDGRGEEAMGA